MSVDEEAVFERVCQALRYSDSAGFLKDESEVINIKQKMILQEAKEKLKIDAVYFIQTAPNALPIPVVYFKKLRAINLNEIRELHRRIWNQGRAPILFVITPSEIRIYDCFSPPPETQLEDFDANRLVKKLESVVDEEKIRQELSEYSREKLDIGGLWDRDDKQFNAENRADQHLLRNLRILRRGLIEERLDYKHVHNLIGRSIFILYLEDRGALKEFLTTFEKGNYSSFRKVLRDKESTYKLFRTVGRHFNGDMFPVSDEEETCVTQRHLSKLENFLSGTDLKSGQMRLWPYSFDVIPIEFISSVYEEFFHSEETKPEDKNTTHYTPLFLVDFLLDQVLPTNLIDNTSILDPSCGSGIFLVATYRRLIASRIAEGNEKLSPDVLKGILQENIFGIDINGEAIRVAAFSLYLTMLDYIEPKSLWQHEGLFPQLINNNLFQKNFITSDILKNKKFDIIVGNTPWGSTLNSEEMRYCQRRGWTIGDRQVAQAFLWKSLNIADASSIICLIVTAKGFLFNRNPENRRFRKKFITGTDIQTVINFSALRRDIFENAIGPAVAVIYSPKKSIVNNPNILYVVPKPSVETRKLGAIIIDYSDIKQIPKDLVINDDTLWKSAMWGTPRDWLILSQLRQKTTLRNVVKRFGWTESQGFQIKGSSKNMAEWMTKLPLFPHKHLSSFNIPRQYLKYDHNLKVFHRPKSPKLYKAPLCLIKGSPEKGKIVAAFSGMDLCFNEQIIGIAGKKEDDYLLKTLTCFLNSSLVQYILFLTSSSWGVERDYILVDEYLDLPFIFLEKESKNAEQIVQLHDEMAALAAASKQDSALWKDLSERIDEIIFNLFELSAVDRDIIKDTIRYTIAFFQNKENSIACKPPDETILLNYAERFQGVIDTLLEGQEKSVLAKIYTGSENLVIASFVLQFGNDAPDTTIIKAPKDLEGTLLKLYQLMKEKVSNRVYFKRVLKMYDGNSIYFLKPSENRYWTVPASYNDADETVAEILETWSEYQLA
jgi:type I restriction-modification system DNA methylase subunit